MLELLCFVLCSFGLTFMLVYGSIFDKIRPKKENGKLGELTNCTLCTGFWVGMLLCVISPFTSLFMFEPTLANAFVLGCLSAGTSYVLSALIGDKGLQVSGGE